MSGLLMPVIGLRAVDANGVPIAGAKLQFYLTGTTTPTPVYTSASLSTPLSNPVVADSTGLFPEMFYNSTITYRAQLQTGAGAVIDDVDPVVAPYINAAGSVTGSMLASGAAVANLGFTPVNKAADTATNLQLAYTALDLGGKNAGYIGAPVNRQNNNYSLALSDAGGCVLCDATGGFTWTIQPFATVAFPQGTAILLRNRAAGAITLAPASGVTLRKAGLSGSASISLATWGFATIYQDETNEWVASGVAFT